MSKYQFRESDIYLPGTDIPRNRPRITEAELQPVTHFDEACFKSLHQRTWASLYSWAGEYRSVDMPDIQGFTERRLTNSPDIL